MTLGDMVRRAGFFAVRDNSLASTNCLALDTVVAKSSLAAWRRRYFCSSMSRMPSTNFRRSSESASGDLMSVFGQAFRCSIRRLCSKTASASYFSCFLTSKRRIARTGSSTNPKRRDRAFRIKAKSVSFLAFNPLTASEAAISTHYKHKDVRNILCMLYTRSCLYKDGRV